MWRGEAVDHLVLFWRESQEGEHIRRDMSELTPQGFSPNQEQKQNFLSMAPHGSTSQHCMWDTLCKTPCGLAWDLPPPVSDLDPSFTEPQTQMVLYFRKSRGTHHACRGVQSYHALSCLSIAASSPKDSQYSSVPFFIAAGYKTLVISETSQIQGLSPETTITKIIDFKARQPTEVPHTGCS